MVCVCLLNLISFLWVCGVGMNKLESYGEFFVVVINWYCCEYE